MQHVNVAQFEVKDNTKHAGISLKEAIYRERLKIEYGIDPTQAFAVVTVDEVDVGQCLLEDHRVHSADQVAVLL